MREPGAVDVTEREASIVRRVRMTLGVTGGGIAFCVIGLTPNWVQPFYAVPTALLGLGIATWWIADLGSSRHEALAGWTGVVLIAALLLVVHHNWRVQGLVIESGGPPDPAARNLVVEVSDRNCSASWDGSARLDVVESDESVTIRAWTRRRWIASCDDELRAVQFTVALGAPIGDREIITPLWDALLQEEPN